jgi:hypothetical protein
MTATGLRVAVLPWGLLFSFNLILSFDTFLYIALGTLEFLGQASKFFFDFPLTAN